MSETAARWRRRIELCLLHGCVTGTVGGLLCGATRADELATLVRLEREPLRHRLTASMPEGFQRAEQDRLQRRPTDEANQHATTAVGHDGW